MASTSQVEKSCKIILYNCTRSHMSEICPLSYRILHDSCTGILHVWCKNPVHHLQESYMSSSRILHDPCKNPARLVQESCTRILQIKHKILAGFEPTSSRSVSMRPWPLRQTSPEIYGVSFIYLRAVRRYYIGIPTQCVDQMRNFYGT